ncbi:MAG TPA: hypothetical protein VGD43_17690 [Micromonospora sp.]
MRRWRTQRRFARLVGRIRVPATGDSAALCQAVSEHLDRPIQLIPLPLPVDAPCGLVITTRSAHYVAYDNQTSPLHQRHIVAHELGHLLAGHSARPVGETDLARLLMPTRDPGVVTAVLARTPGYDEQAEKEAELIADLLWKHTTRRTGGPARQLDPADADLVERIRQSLGE